MKWRGLESTQGQFVTEHPDNLIAWASSHNLAVRGHSLLWAKKKNNPTWTHSLFGLVSADIVLIHIKLCLQEFEEAVYKHIDETMIHFNKVGVRDWDVINEMVDQVRKKNRKKWIIHSYIFERVSQITLSTWTSLAILTSGLKFINTSGVPFQTTGCLSMTMVSWWTAMAGSLCSSSSLETFWPLGPLLMALVFSLI